MTDSQQLLVEYAKTGSESAFRELVSCYSNLVYSTALRLVGGDTHLAEDVAQTVFMGLASRGRALSTEVMLGGWLHQHTYHVATKTLRADRRRQSREREAVEMNTLQDDPGAGWREVAPILDEAITRLGSEDRAAILLRFFEQRDFRSVGEALGSDEDAARMRVNRALEKLHSLLKHRGVTLSVAALGTALATQAVTAAPAGFAGSVAATALASAAAGEGMTATLVKLMTTTKVKLGIIGVIAVAGVATSLVIQQSRLVRLREQSRSFQQQADQLADQLAQQRVENEELSNLIAQASATSGPAGKQLNELLRLRGEVGLLRAQSTEQAKLRDEKRSLRFELAVSQDTKAIKKPPEVPREDIFPKHSWAFAGFATPEATLQSIHWAAMNGDLKTLANCYSSPEEGAQATKEFEGQSESEIAAFMNSWTTNLLAYRILTRASLKDGNASLTYYYDGSAIIRIMELERTGAEWRIAPGQQIRPLPH